MARKSRSCLMMGCALAASLALSACGGGGGGGGVASTPTPPAAPVPPPPAPPPPPPPPPASSSFNTAEYQRSNGASQAKAITAYDNGATGQGIIAGVVDSGVNATLAEFSGRIHPASGDFAGGRGVGDEGGHGTAVSGVLLAAKNNSGVHGVAFNATLFVARTDTPGSCANTAADEGCQHEDNDIARGMDGAVAAGARVINVSLGGSPPNANLRAAINRATAAGVIIVFSAGNDFDTDPVAGANPDPLAQIANDISVSRNLVLIAGALTSSNANLTAFSNRAGNGAAHYVAALGSGVRTVDENGTLVSASGSSFAAPIVAGAVALLTQAFPTMTPAQIVDLLLRSAVDLGAIGVDGTFGHGALDISRAFSPMGSTSLAGSLVPVTSGQTGTTSTAMGDGGQSGAMETIILDDYARPFSVDLGGTVRRAPLPAKLAPGLGIGTQSLAASNGAMAVTLSLADRGRHAAIDRLLLSAHEERRARAIAGSVVTKLGPKTALAMGISRSGIALARELDGGGWDAFLIGDRAGDGFGFDARAKSGIALRHDLGGFALTASAESGAARLWESDAYQAVRRGYHSHGYGAIGLGISRSFGPVGLSVRATNLIERETVLGGRFDAFYGSPGARSWFADLGASWTPARDWTLSAAWRQGWTRIGAGGARLGTDRLRSSAWSFDASKARLFTADDRLGLRIAQPLRVSGGGFDLTLPTSYDIWSGATTTRVSRLNLAPTGREIDVEAAYARALWGGFVSGNLFWRNDPGNIEAAPSDVGAAVRFTLGL